MSTANSLSPSAQAVLDAFRAVPDLRDCPSIAAVLRAAAEKLSQEVDAPNVDGMKYTGIWHAFDYLNAIAAELEGQ